MRLVPPDDRGADRLSADSVTTGPLPVHLPPRRPHDEAGADAEVSEVDHAGVGGRARIGPGFESLLSAARTGAPWALERLYQAMAPAVAGYLRVQGVLDADDLTNEVFLSVLTRVGSFAGDEDQFRSWVFTIAHSRLVDERRRTHRRPQTAGGDDALVDIVGGNAEDDAVRRLSDQRVQALCEQLVPDQRDVLLLRLMGGFTVEAIAQVVGKSEGAVKALQRRGVANLAKVFRPEPVPLRASSTVTGVRCLFPTSTTVPYKPC